MDQTQRTFRETEVIEHHFHPQLSVTTPNGRLRVGALTFNSAADAENVVLGLAGGTITYIFKDALGAPGAGEVHVKVQGSVALTVQKLAQAIRGETDAANIAYNVQAANAGFTAAYTSQRVSIGTVVHANPPTLIFVGKVGDSATAATLTTTTSGAGVYLLTAITRIYSQRYVLTGNAAALIDRVAGAYQCICPIGSVRNPFESGFPVCKYDVGKMVVEACHDDALVVECDGYYSADEITFTPLWYGLEMSRTPSTNGSQMFPVNSSRIPAGAGFYIKMRSNGTDPTDWIDFKAQYHIYPTNLS